MASNALLAWSTDRVARLTKVEADCQHLEALHASDPGRAQEYIRSYLLLLSAEFQGFCRDLHAECAAKLVMSVMPIALQSVLQSQCTWGRKLDTGNPNAGNLGADFNRYQLDFWDEVIRTDTRHAQRKDALDKLNTWRNAIAHHDYDPAKLGGTTTLTILQVQDFRSDCNELAAAFDRVLLQHIQTITSVAPWPP